ncbi:transcription antitermination factor NusB [Marinihelvus fidelis]|nr:transcription antitermination factor NusB [Marinihelvus fidelis]
MNKRKTADRNAWEPRSRARRRALQALYQWRMTDQAINDILVQFRETQDFKGVDDDYFEQLVRGVERSSPELATQLDEFMDRELARCDLMEQLVLLISAWQLRNEPETPGAVVLDEAADLANRFGSAQTHSYVTAVLDRAARAWGALPAAPAGE